MFHDKDAFDNEPTETEMAEMYDALPRPPLTDYAAWIAEGIECASEVRAFERSRSALMRWIYGDDAEAA